MFGGEDSTLGTQPPSTAVTAEAEPMFENTWQIIGTFSDGADTDTSADTNVDPAAPGMSMDMTTMWNINMLTPLNAAAINVILCLAGGAIFAVGLGAVSNLILKKTSLI